MAPYLAAFILSTAFVGLAGSSHVTSRVVRVLVSSVGVIIVAALAGVRDLETGGTDILVYGNRMFYSAVSASSLGESISGARAVGIDYEFGYVWLNHIVSRFTDDPHWFYFFLAALTASLVLTAIMLFRDYATVAVMWLTYLFTSYVEGFNLLRQGPALAFVLLGIALTLRTRYRFGLVVGLVGTLFHVSAMIFLPMWIAVVFLLSRQKTSGRAVLLVVLVTTAAVLGSSYVLELASTSLEDTKYGGYLSEGARGGSAIGGETLYRLVPLAVGMFLLARSSHPTPPQAPRPQLASAVSSRSTVKRTAGGERGAGGRGVPAIETRTTATLDGVKSDTGRRILIVLLVLLVIELITLPIREISYPLYRIPMYFGLMRILAYGMIAAQVKTHKLLAGVGAIVFSATYFFFVVIYRNGAVYHSAILDAWFVF